MSYSRKFFRGIKWQPAYVFDPQAETRCFFFWNENNLEQETVSIIPDKDPITKMPSINFGEKISVSLTEEEEIKANKTRLSYVALAVIIFIFAIISGLTIFILYRHNRELEKNQEEYQRQVRQFRLDFIQQQREDKTDRDTQGHVHRRKIEEHEQKIEGQRIIINRLQAELDSLKKNHAGDSEIVKGLQRDLEKAQREREDVKRKLTEIQDLSLRTPPPVRGKKQLMVAPSPPPPNVAPPKPQLPVKEAMPATSWYEYCYPWNWF